MKSNHKFIVLNKLHRLINRDRKALFRTFSLVKGILLEIFVWARVWPLVISVKERSNFDNSCIEAQNFDVGLEKANMRDNSFA